MKQAEISRAFKRKVGQEVQLEAEGLDRFNVYTPFQFDDGDHYVVVLKRVGGNWVLTDEGHTFMHLSYSGVDLSTHSRARMIDQALSTYRVQNDSGELRLVVPGKEFGDALFSFVQALGRIAQTTLWTQERVSSTFFEDAMALVETTVPIGRAQRRFIDPAEDPAGSYPIDIMVSGANAMKWFIFAVKGPTECQQATIACLHYEKSKFAFKSLVIYENQEKLPSRFVAQLGDVSGKSFSTLGQKDRIREFLENDVLGTAGLAAAVLNGTGV